MMSSSTCYRLRTSFKWHCEAILQLQIQIARITAVMADLLDHIEWPSVECLNQHPSHNIGNALKQVGCRLDSRRCYDFPKVTACEPAAEDAAALDPISCCLHRATGKTTACIWSLTQTSSSS